MAALRGPARAAALGVGAAGVAVAVTLALVGGSPGLAPPSAPLSVAASFEPVTVQFGDELTATVTVLLDRDAVRPETLRLSDDLAPMTQLGPSRTSTTVSGRLETVSVRVPVACLTAPCAAGAGVTAIALPHVRASAVSRSGRADAVTAAWPRLRVRSRLVRADLVTRRPPFAADSSPAAPRFRLPPTTLALALDAFAAACAAGALLLLGLQFAALLRRRRPDAGELERALRLVRAAELRPPPDRRRALGMLARVLDPRDGVLGRAADGLAWSEPDPDREQLHGLLERIERTGER